MRSYKVTTQPKDTKSYLVEVDSREPKHCHLRMFNRLNNKTCMKRIPKDQVFVDLDYKHPRAAKLRKVYIKQSYVDLELNIYESL